MFRRGHTPRTLLQELPTIVPLDVVASCSQHWLEATMHICIRQVVEATMHLCISRHDIRNQRCVQNLIYRYVFYGLARCRCGCIAERMWCIASDKCLTALHLAPVVIYENIQVKEALLLHETGNDEVLLKIRDRWGADRSDGSRLALHTPDASIQVQDVLRQQHLLLDLALDLLDLVLLRLRSVDPMRGGRSTRQHEIALGALAKSFAGRRHEIDDRVLAKGLHRFLHDRRGRRARGGRVERWSS